MTQADMSHAYSARPATVALRFRISLSLSEAAPRAALQPPDLGNFFLAISVRGDRWLSQCGGDRAVVGFDPIALRSIPARARRGRGESSLSRARCAFSPETPVGTSSLISQFSDRAFFQNFNQILMVYGTPYI